MSTRQHASPPAREWPSVHPEQAVCLLTLLLLTLVGFWAPTHKLNKVKLDLLPRGLFYLCQWWHLIAGLMSHIWQKAACWSAAHSNPLLLTEDFAAFQPASFYLKGRNSQSPLWCASSEPLVSQWWVYSKRGSQTAEGSIKSAITAALPSAVGLKSVKECPGVGPKAEQSGIRCT